MIERSPLWPARPPPALTFSSPGGRSSSSWTTMICSGDSIRYRRTSALTAWPESFMNVIGNASTTRSSPSAPGSLVSATSALSRPPFNVTPRRSASSRTASSPTLWRVRAYFSPGLPSPTTSQSNGSPLPIRPNKPISGLGANRSSSRCRRDHSPSESAASSPPPSPASPSPASPSAAASAAPLPRHRGPGCAS